MRDELLSPEPNSDDVLAESLERFIHDDSLNDEGGLRPRTLAEFVGQTELKEHLQIILEAARRRGQAVRPVDVGISAWRATVEAGDVGEIGPQQADVLEHRRIGVIARQHRVEELAIAKVSLALAIEPAPPFGVRGGTGRSSSGGVGGQGGRGEADCAKARELHRIAATDSHQPRPTVRDHARHSSGQASTGLPIVLRRPNPCPPLAKRCISVGIFFARKAACRRRVLSTGTAATRSIGRGFGFISAEGTGIG